MTLIEFLNDRLWGIVGSWSLPNLLATFVKRIRTNCFSKNSQFWKHTEFDEMMYFTDQIWNVFFPRYKASISEQTILFNAVLEKARGHSNPIVFVDFYALLENQTR